MSASGCESLRVQASTGHIEIKLPFTAVCWSGELCRMAGCTCVSEAAVMIIRLRIRLWQEMRVSARSAACARLTTQFAAPASFLIVCVMCSAEHWARGPSQEPWRSFMPFSSFTAMPFSLHRRRFAL